MTDFNYLTLRPGERCLISSDPDRLSPYIIQLVPTPTPNNDPALGAKVALICMQWRNLEHMSGWDWVAIEPSSKEMVYRAMVDAACYPGRWYTLTVTRENPWTSPPSTYPKSGLN
jgi:hypothetical protein